jgi:hypothetical protein
MVPRKPNLVERIAADGARRYTSFDPVNFSSPSPTPKWRLAASLRFRVDDVNSFNFLSTQERLQILAEFLKVIPARLEHRLSCGM